MKNKLLYERTVNILVDAYFNDTLVPMDCTACAVGNLVAANMGYRLSEKTNQWIHPDGKSDSPKWSNVHTITRCLSTNVFVPSVWPEQYKGTAQKEIDSTGYTFKQTSKIEVAFENGQIGESEDEKMFNGLMAVIEVLDIIHSNTDQEVTKVSKQRFVKQIVCKQ